jgi:hypothetical protein
MPVAVAATTVAAVTLLGCAHPVRYDPFVATVDIEQAASEAANDAGLDLYFGYQCELDPDVHDRTRFSVNCETTTGNGRYTTFDGEGQADSSRHYHGRFTIYVENRPVQTLHCLGPLQAPRC